MGSSAGKSKTTIPATATATATELESKTEEQLTQSETRRVVVSVDQSSQEKPKLNLRAKIRSKHITEGKWDEESGDFILPARTDLKKASKETQKHVDDVIKKLVFLKILPSRSRNTVERVPFVNRNILVKESNNPRSPPPSSSRQRMVRLLNFSKNPSPQPPEYGFSQPIEIHSDFRKFSQPRPKDPSINTSSASINKSNIHRASPPLLSPKQRSTNTNSQQSQQPRLQLQWQTPLTQNQENSSRISTRKKAVYSFHNDDHPPSRIQHHRIDQNQSLIQQHSNSLAMKIPAQKSSRESDFSLPKLPPAIEQSPQTVPKSRKTTIPFAELSPQHAQTLQILQTDQPSGRSKVYSIRGKYTSSNRNNYM